MRKNFYILKEHLIRYPTPLNFNYFWSFGSLAGIFLGVQLVTGIMLAMHYTPHVSFAFLSIEHIMRDVNYGWLLRYMHANGASFFFIMVYAHIVRGIYYISYKYPYQNLWRVGVIIFILMMATAFMGYVLPWGQMSFWGATVITNLFTAIPFVGESIALWLWGGFSVDNATLNRFFSLHYLLPFVIVGVVFLHLIVLHIPGSTNPLKINTFLERIPFFPYYYHKDLFSFLFVFFIFLYFVGYFPNFLGHPDNYIEANPLSTPSHIVPEWYFLPFYAMLRSIPDKLGGVLCMFGSLIILFFLPNLRNVINIIELTKNNNIYFNLEILTLQFNPVKQFFFWLFFFDMCLLGWLGAQPVEYPFITLGLIATLFYFFYIICIIPLLVFFEIILISFYFKNKCQN